jgi:hypothetical protein
MTGSLLATPWEGHRNEAFAAYALSSIATVVKVPREADVGFDLLCTLMHYEPPQQLFLPIRGNPGIPGFVPTQAIKIPNSFGLLYAGRSFGLQIKSSSERKIVYGGVRKQKWKKYEIDWLFQQDQPLLIGLVDLEKTSLCLYSTHRIWQIFNEIRAPGRIVLLPDEEPKGEIGTLKRFRKVKLPTSKNNPITAGDGFSYDIPLGKPIVCIQMEQIEKNYGNLRTEIERLISEVIEIDYRNIANRHFDIPISEEQTDSHHTAIYHSANGEKIKAMLRSIAPIIISLMQNKHNLSSQSDLESVIYMAKMLRENRCLDIGGILLLEQLTS